MKHKLHEIMNKGKLPAGEELNYFLVRLAADYANEILDFAKGYSISEAPILVAALKLAADTIKRTTENTLDIKGLITFMHEENFLYETVKKSSTTESIVFDERAMKRNNPDDKAASEP